MYFIRPSYLQYVEQDRYFVPPPYSIVYVSLWVRVVEIYVSCCKLGSSLVSVSSYCYRHDSHGGMSAISSSDATATGTAYVEEWTE